MTDTPDWAALAAEVRRRRERFRLPVDLIDHGGPAEMTVRKIESGEPVSIRPKTKTRLEHALNMPSGLVDKILDGTATQEDLNTVSGAGGVGTPTVTVGAANVGTLSARTPGWADDPRATVVTVTEMVARLAAERDRNPEAEDALGRLKRILPELWGDNPKESE